MTMQIFEEQTSQILHEEMGLVPMLESIIEQEHYIQLADSNALMF